MVCLRMAQSASAWTRLEVTPSVALVGTGYNSRGCTSETASLFVPAGGALRAESYFGRKSVNELDYESLTPLLIREGVKLRLRGIAGDASYS